MSKRVYGLDLGTSEIKIYKKGKGVVLIEKNVIAMKNRRNTLAIGDEAYEMFEKTPEDVEITFPVRNGVLAEIDHMKRLFDHFILRINRGTSPLPSEYIVAIPTDITEVERKAFTDLVSETNRARAKSIKVVEKPIAAALGADLDITNARGVMMVDIGAATTEVAVISLGGIVISKLLPIGGDSLDESIVANIKKKCNLLIGKKTAEILKINLGFAYAGVNSEMSVHGRNVITGLPQEINVQSTLVYDAIKEHLNAIIDAIKLILERTPPEIAADIIESGIYVSGGSAGIKRLDELINEHTELEVNICDEPQNTVIRGLGRIIEEPSLSVLAFEAKRR